MRNNYESKKYGADRIVFLCLFVIGLFVAWFIVVSRNRILLSEPVKLSSAGLSVSMPSGNGWHCEKRWRYSDSGFVLRSFFTVRSKVPVAVAECNYRLAGRKMTIEERFRQKAAETFSRIEEKGRIQADEVVFDWIYVKNQKSSLDIFFGTAELPNNHRLDIEISRMAGDKKLVEKPFRKIIEGLRFQQDNYRQAGVEIVSEIKRKGLISLLAGQKHKSCFLIQDSRGRANGFTIESYNDLGLLDDFDIGAVSFYYISGRYKHEQTISAWSRSDLGHFKWETETINPSSKNRIEADVNESNVMTVTGSGFQDSLNEFQISPSAVPEVFIEVVFRQMLDIGYDEVVVDVIKADASVCPVRIRNISGEADNNSQTAAYMLRTEILDGSGFVQEMYFDWQKQIVKRVLKQEQTYQLKPCSVDEILQQFPDLADYILEKADKQ